jgi:hypothetical protein
MYIQIQLHISNNPTAHLTVLTPQPNTRTFYSTITNSPTQYEIHVFSRFPTP